MEWKAATPAESVRAEDPGVSAAREAAEAVPAESVRMERNEKMIESFMIKNPAAPKSCGIFILDIFFCVLWQFAASDDLVDQTILKRTLSCHEVIAVCIFRNDFQRLTCTF